MLPKSFTHGPCCLQAREFLTGKDMSLRLFISKGVGFGNMEHHENSMTRKHAQLCHFLIGQLPREWQILTD